MVWSSRPTAAPPAPSTTSSDNPLMHYSMCAIDSKYVYVSGGKYYRGDDEQASCYRYEIDNDLWQDAPSMNIARMGHSSCQLQGYLYVFGGNGSDKAENNSVEKLPIVSDPVQQAGKQWELIPESNLVNLPINSGHFCCPLNS